MTGIVLGNKKKVDDLKFPIQTKLKVLWIKKKHTQINYESTSDRCFPHPRQVQNTVKVTAHTT